MSGSLRSTKNTLILEKNDIEAKITDNSQRIRDNSRRGSNETSMIHFDYDQEKAAIQNEIDSLDDDKTSDEYADLMDELKELDDKEEREVKVSEEETTDFETTIQLENDTLEVQLEDIQQLIESFGKALTDVIEKTFKPFAD